VPKLLEPVYASRCVDGPWPILANDLHSAVVPQVTAVAAAPSPPPASKPRRYVVRRGDTLGAIVHKHGCGDLRGVTDLNDLGKHHRIKPGQVLKLPECR
jgi:membrane-bound lytic murein transglycosylase D